MLEDSDCSCKCPTGYFGRSCENYVLGSWKSVNFDKQLGEILVRWHLGPSYWKGAGRIQRYERGLFKKKQPEHADGER